jgi:hypothetical protein
MVILKKCISSSEYGYWFYVPILAPHIGGIIGFFLYDLFIGLHWPLEDSDLNKGQQSRDVGIDLKAMESADEPQQSQ